MEACQGVERDINNVADKFSNLGESNHRILEEAIQLVRAAKDEIRDGKDSFETCKGHDTVVSLSASDDKRPAEAYCEDRERLLIFSKGVSF